MLYESCWLLLIKEDPPSPRSPSEVRRTDLPRGCLRSHRLRTTKVLGLLNERDDSLDTSPPGWRVMLTPSIPQSLGPLPARRYKNHPCGWTSTITPEWVRSTLLTVGVLGGCERVSRRRVLVLSLLFSGGLIQVLIPVPQASLPRAGKQPDIRDRRYLGKSSEAMNIRSGGQALLTPFSPPSPRLR